MHHHPDTQGHRSGDVYLLSADQWDIPQAEIAGGDSRKDRMNIRRGCEKDRDDVIRFEAVSLDHLCDE